MRLLVPVMVLVTGAAFAQQPPPPADVEPIPDGPPVAGSSSLEDDFEPEVTIRRAPDSTIEEYRANGRVYMIKVTPRLGIPYFLVDSDGDGTYEVRYNELDNNTLIPGWVLFSW